MISQRKREACRLDTKPLEKAWESAWLGMNSVNCSVQNTQDVHDVWASTFDGSKKEAVNRLHYLVYEAQSALRRLNDVRLPYESDDQ